MTIEELKSLKIGDKVIILKSECIDTPTVTKVVMGAHHTDTTNSGWVLFLEDEIKIFTPHDLRMAEHGLYLDHINSGMVQIYIPVITDNYFKNLVDSFISQEDQYDE